MSFSTICWTDVHDELAFHRARFGEEVGRIREIGDMVKACDRVKSGLWDTSVEVTLFFWIRGPCEKELGNNLVHSLARVHICGRKRESAQVEFCPLSVAGKHALANVREERGKEVR